MNIFSEAMADALDTMFETFGESTPITYVRGSSVSFLLQAVAEPIEEIIEPADTMDVKIKSVSLFVSFSEFNESLGRPAIRDTVLYNGESWQVASWQTDNCGSIQLRVEIREIMNKRLR